MCSSFALNAAMQNKMVGHSSVKIAGGPSFIIVAEDLQARQSRELFVVPLPGSPEKLVFGGRKTKSIDVLLEGDFFSGNGFRYLDFDLNFFFSIGKSTPQFSSMCEDALFVHLLDNIFAMLKYFL